MNHWELMKTWKMVLPPNRPSEKNVACIEDVIKGLPSRQNACILGSTPEYRTLLRKWFSRVTIIDKSMGFKAVSDQLSGKSENECFCHSDWLNELPKRADSFDLVVSHTTHGNIVFCDRSRFFRLIEASLRDYGIFVDTIFQPPTKLFGIDEICSLFSGRPNNLRTTNDFNCIAIFQSKKIAEDGLIDSSKILDWLEAEIDDPDILRIVKSTEDVCPRGMTWHYSVDRGPETFGYMDLFSIQRERRQPDSSPFSEAMTQVVCSSRRRHG